jgi:C4-dicarboxylate transporter, DctM subunit
MDNTVITIIGFASLFILIILRVPLGVSMGIVGIGGFAMTSDLETALKLLVHSPIRTATDYTFGLIPMFILMGVFAGASGMSKELFRSGNAWLGHRRGGVAFATILACGGFAAICGSSVATAATMAKVALPEMRRFGYHDRVATGVIAAGGTLGILIPPSVVLAIYGIITEQDIGQLFIAGFIPGLLAVFMYLLAMQFVVWMDPKAVPAGRRHSWSERLKSTQEIWAVLAIFLFVIGGIYGGIFTPTEAASMGAGGTFLIAVFRRSLSRRQFIDCLIETVTTTGALFTILIGALLFGFFLAVTETPQRLADLLIALPFGPHGILIILLAFYLLMGCFMESLSIIILTVPIIFPTIVALGFDPIWFGVIVVMTVELGLITPPYGINVFVIKSIATDVKLGTIFKGVLPFVFIDIIRLGILIAFPWLVLFLPNTMD